MKPGEEWVYRARDAAPSQRVLVRTDNRDRRPPRIEIEFLDGEKAGTFSSVSPRRLPRPWAEVAEYDQLMSDWQRISEYELDRVEDFAVCVVFERLVPEDAATVDQGYSRNCVGIHDVALLEKATGRPLDYFTAAVPSFHHDNTSCASRRG